MPQDPFVLTSVGLNWLLSRLKGQGVPISHMAIGIGSTSPASTDTALDNEIARVPLTNPGGTILGDSMVFDAEYPIGVGIGTVMEAGLFDAPAGGNLIARCLKGPYLKDNATGLSLTMTIQIQSIATP
ncbi:MAG: hypothetical protein HQL95_04645 [Magnetococcales bacterium]|nr:hypothetical protein [Magnetococcales bacterium]